ncbi:MAG TPA: DUF6266 family protein [Salinivirgaceae bacterium]|nr:DUF6266 family protein [Salinivirgaceae bacterium]
MAQHNQKSLVDLTGKLGPIVLYSMNGKTIARSMPRKRTKKTSEKAQAAQQAFAHVMKLMQQVKPIVKIGFSQTAHVRTAFQEAMSVNLNAFRQSENRENLETWLQLSEGTRMGLENLRIEPATCGVVIEWDFDETDSTSIRNDLIAAVAINRKNHYAYYSLGAATRSQKKVSVNVPCSENSDTYSVFIFALSNIPVQGKDSSLISQSQWVGNIEINGSIQS